MAGGGTGGHVIPLVAVARELRSRGHDVFFVGTRNGFEATLVPAEGFAIEWIEIGGLKRVGVRQTLRTLGALRTSLAACVKLIGIHRPNAVFSLGGYVAGPPVLAALLRRVPVVVLEPNAVPGLANRRVGRFVAKALIAFDDARRFFPAGRTELIGLPVREEFFLIPPKTRGEVLSVLITGGSRGSRKINEAVREMWPLVRASGIRLRLVHQTGPEMEADIARDFLATGIDGRVTAFIADMPSALAEADIVVCRAGAGAVAELAAAGKPAILVPFPFAAADHQKKNAEATERAGAAIIIADHELKGQRLLDGIREVNVRLEAMGRAAQTLAKPGAAKRAADALEEVAA